MIAIRMRSFMFIQLWLECHMAIIVQLKEAMLGDCICGWIWDDVWEALCLLICGWIAIIVSHFCGWIGEWELIENYSNFC